MVVNLGDFDRIVDNSDVVRVGILILFVDVSDRCNVCDRAGSHFAVSLVYRSSARSLLPLCRIASMQRKIDATKCCVFLAFKCIEFFCAAASPMHGGLTIRKHQARFLGIFFHTL